MFTGLVQTLGSILFAVETGKGKRIAIALGDLAAASIAMGDSICVSGVCLTVIKVGGGAAEFDVITETLDRTTLGEKMPRDAINLELSLRGDSFLGGHFVQGHVDGIAAVLAVKEDPQDWRITFQIPAGCAPCIVPKGSVTVDGVSMTIAEAGADSFTVALIPTTLQKTTLGTLRPGDKVNLETDILARTVVHYLQNLTAQQQAPGTSHAPLTRAKLQELGFA